MTQEQWARVGEILELLAAEDVDPMLRAEYNESDEELPQAWEVSYRAGKMHRHIGATPLEAAEAAFDDYFGGPDA